MRNSILVALALLLLPAVADARSYRHRHVHHVQHHRSAGVSMACLRPATRAMVGQLQSRIGPMTIVSTCGGTHVHNSEHYRGNAVDFHPQRVSIARAAAVARSLPIVGGVGTYPSHVHADVGRAHVSWHRGGPRTQLASRGHRQRYASRGFHSRYASYPHRYRAVRYAPAYAPNPYGYR